MGSLLGPLLANAFMSHIEENLEREVKLRSSYRRYVDDTLMTIRSPTVKALFARSCIFSSKTCLIRGCTVQTKTSPIKQDNNKKCCKLLIECLMAFKFHRARSNTIKQHQTRCPRNVWRPNTAKHFSLVNKHITVSTPCLLLFDRV